MKRFLTAVLAALWAAALSGQMLALAIPAEELGRPPTAQRVNLLVDSAAQNGWGPWVAPLRTAALQVYRRDPAAAGPWYHLYRWAAKLAIPQADATRAWMRAIEEAHLVHPNLPRSYDMTPAPLASLLSADLQKWALGNAAFSAEYFDTVSPLDQPAEVLRILQALYAANPPVFADYASLALAIAVVYDTPPPPDWPHGQVNPVALPRRLPPPQLAFAYWTHLDQTHASGQSLRRLPAAELKFVVDASAPLAELAWARQAITEPLPDFAKVYDRVKYLKDRVTANAFIWPGNDYRLSTILQTGGICIDQAYFASNAGKARGIPTLLFHGAGRDGRHAWFGYLGTSGWNLDAGRYADQKFVVGQAFDPQTWKYLNDHELLFLSERFRALPLFALSAINADFAEEFLRDQDFAGAMKAAREAVNRERRNLHAWEILVTAEAAGGRPAREVEGTLREAQYALQHYPDLEVSFSKLLVQSLRQRGEASAATAEEQRIVHKYQSSRDDLSIQSAADMLENSMNTEDFPAQVKTYQNILTTYGTGAGFEFYDRIVSRFARHCVQVSQKPTALECVVRARKVLRIDPGGQLDQEMTRLTAEIQGAN